MFVVSGVAASKMTIRIWRSFTETIHIRSSTPRPLRTTRDGESASVPHCADAGHPGATCYGQLSTRVTNALPATLGPPGQLPFGIPRVPGGPRGPTGFNLITWRNFYNGLQNMVALPNHPLESYEGRTFIYFSHFADLVLNTINGRRRHQHFAVLDRLVIDIHQPHLPAIQQPQIHITGESGFVLTSNGEPFCIVELKRFIPQNRLFNNGRRQALVYAAALGHLRADGRPVLAIVTDLQRWQFFEVTDTDYSQSALIQVTYNQQGVPDQAPLRYALTQMLAFITQRWRSTY
jgi:hypothetical protein